MGFWDVWAFWGVDGPVYVGLVLWDWLVLAVFGAGLLRGRWWFGRCWVLLVWCESLGWFGGFGLTDFVVSGFRSSSVRLGW